MPSPPLGRVLVVDDNEDLAYSFCCLLNLSGYDAIEAHSAEAALQTASAFKPHVLISDLGMPGMSGYDLALETRRTIAPPPYLISVSGWGNYKTFRESHNAGFNVHLGKR